MHLNPYPLSRSALVVLAAGLVGAAAAPASVAESPFLGENNTAMARMMAGMEIVPSGDTDRDFAAMMIAHHQGAIDMARAELHYGHSEQLRRLAQGIIVEQQQEIAVMRLALDEQLRPSVAVPAPATKVR